jgi:hypothetical protein
MHLAVDRKNQLRGTIMGGTSVEVGDLIYEVVAPFTSITDYGANVQAILAGAEAPPAEGAQIDFAFQGTFCGPRLSGSVAGVDYAHARADGRVDLHIHASLTTQDGARIAFFADGVAIPGPDSVWQLRENCRFLTSFADYRWLNGIQAWGIGSVDLGRGEVRIKVYAAAP